MPRDSSGNYTLPAGNPVAPGTTIQSTWANTTMDDVALALTDSLDRNGRGGMLAAFGFTDGTNLLPGATWTNEPTSGLYRNSAGDLRMVMLTNEVMRWEPSGASVWDGSSWQVVLYPTEPSYVAALDGKTDQTDFDAHTGDSSIHFADATADGTLYGRIDNGWAPVPAGVSSLNDLSDVTLTTPASTEVLQYSGTEWVNSLLGISDISGLQTALDAKADVAGDTFTGPVLIDSGTVAAPGLALSADTNTGFYRVGQDVIGVAINGVKVIEFRSDGVYCLQNLQAFQP